MSEWLTFKTRAYSPFNKEEAPFDGKPFLASMWGESVGTCIYARHYDSTEDRVPSKYEFFYFTENPEEDGLQIRIEQTPFPITHWMPLPEPPK